VKRCPGNTLTCAASRLRAARDGAQGERADLEGFALARRSLGEGGSERAGESEGRSPSVRLDIWLDVACLFKTRSEAQKACRNGKIEVNGQPAKPNRLVRAGDRLAIGRPFGRKQQIAIRGVTDRHIARPEARQLYEDLTPAPTPEEIEQRRVERIYRAAVTPPRAPDKRERRARRKMKEEG
jgi:ribosome-associated heat shock protein Hsp15